MGDVETSSRGQLWWIDDEDKTSSDKITAFGRRPVFVIQALNNACTVIPMSTSERALKTFESFDVNLNYNNKDGDNIISTPMFENTITIPESMLKNIIGFVDKDKTDKIINVWLDFISNKIFYNSETKEYLRIDEEGENDNEN